MLKCKACGFEANGNQAMGKHYKTEPTHKPSYKTRKLLATLPKNQTVEEKIRGLYQELHDTIEQNNNKISNLQQEISILKQENERLQKLSRQLEPSPVAVAYER